MIDRRTFLSLVAAAIGVKTDTLLAPAKTPASSKTLMMPWAIWDQQLIEPGKPIDIDFFGGARPSQPYGIRSISFGVDDSIPLSCLMELLENGGRAELGFLSIPLRQLMCGLGHDGVSLYWDHRQPSPIEPEIVLPEVSVKLLGPSLPLPRPIRVAFELCGVIQL